MGSSPIHADDDEDDDDLDDDDDENWQVKGVCEALWQQHYSLTLEMMWGAVPSDSFCHDDDHQSDDDHSDDHHHDDHDDDWPVTPAQSEGRAVLLFKRRGVHNTLFATLLQIHQSSQ